MTIESNIPPPNRPHHSMRYNWHLMKVGDSQLFDTPEAGHRAAKASHNYAKHHGWKFISETQPDKTVRIWRIK